MHMRGLIVSALMLIGCIQAFGQENRKEVCIGFPVGNSTLDTAYGNNAASLSDVVSFLESVKKTVRSNWSKFLSAVPPHPRAAYP